MSTNPRDYQDFELPYQNSGFDAELAHTRQSRRGGGCCFFGCCLGCLGFLLLIALLFAGFYYSLFTGGAPLEVSPETTIITEPLKSDGKAVDFHQAIQQLLLPENVQPNENGFRDVLLAYGQAAFETFDKLDEADWQYRETCKHLGIDPQTPPRFTLENQRPGNIRFDSEGLNAVQAAVAKSHYSIPLVRRNENDLVLTSLPVAMQEFHVRFVSAFRDRAMSRFNKEESIAEAWNDMLTATRLFRFVTIHSMWQNTLLDTPDDESRFTPVADVTATLSHWSQEQLEQAVKDLESLPHWQDRQTTLQMIQFVLLDLLSATHDLKGLAASLGVREEDREVFTFLQMIAFDWNLVAKELNREFKAYGELLERVEGKSLEEQFDLLRLRLPGERRDLRSNDEKLEERLEELLRHRFEAGEGLDIFFASGRSKLTGALAGRLLVSWAAGEMYRLQLMEESRCQALRLALALERYYREHQVYPDSLDELRLHPMTPNIDFEYEKFGDRYRLLNKVFRLE
jgi:hypothetical protein